MMKTVSPKLSAAQGCASLILIFLFQTLQADQLNEFSVFQPVNGISANIYIENAAVMVQSSDTRATALNTIKTEYLKHYADKLYAIKDVNQDGTIDIATLDRVDQSATRFCYKVYSYQPSSQQFSTTPAYTECNSAAGTVIYEINSSIAAIK